MRQSYSSSSSRYGENQHQAPFAARVPVEDLVTFEVLPRVQAWMCSHSADLPKTCKALWNTLGTLCICKWQPPLEDVLKWLVESKRVTIQDKTGHILPAARSTSAYSSYSSGHRSSYDSSSFDSSSTQEQYKGVESVSDLASKLDSWLEGLKQEAPSKSSSAATFFPSTLSSLIIMLDDVAEVRVKVDGRFVTEKLKEIGWLKGLLDRGEDTVEYNLPEWSPSPSAFAAVPITDQVRRWHLTSLSPSSMPMRFGVAVESFRSFLEKDLRAQGITSMSALEEMQLPQILLRGLLHGNGSKQNIELKWRDSTLFIEEKPFVPEVPRGINAQEIFEPLIEVIRTDRNHLSQIEITQPSDVPDFDSMKLSNELLRSIYSWGFEKPSLIQGQVIMPISEGRDVMFSVRSYPFIFFSFFIVLLLFILFLFCFVLFYFISFILFSCILFFFYFGQSHVFILFLFYFLLIYVFV